MYFSRRRSGHYHESRWMRLPVCRHSASKQRFKPQQHRDGRTKTVAEEHQYCDWILQTAKSAHGQKHPDWWQKIDMVGQPSTTSPSYPRTPTSSWSNTGDANVVGFCPKCLVFFCHFWHTGFLSYHTFMVFYLTYFLIKVIIHFNIKIK